MKYVFYIFLIVIIGLSLYSAKFNNPYKLVFIFGKKGSGKSTLMVKYMVKYLKKGWSVYTDMVGVNIKGVRYFTTDRLAEFTPDEKSVVFLDEVGLSMDNRNFKSFPAGMRDFFALQRKYKVRVYVNSQSYDVDKKVRDRVDSMILQTNIGNIIGISRPIKRKITLTEATSQGESRIADQLEFGKLWDWRFTWLPRYFKYFTSFNAPARPPLPYSDNEDGLTVRQQLRRIQKGMRKH